VGAWVTIQDTAGAKAEGGSAPAGGVQPGV